MSEYSENLRKKLQDVPHKPGVYLMRDRFGTVIYVGKARDLKRRLSHYFQPSRRLWSDPKLSALIDAIADFDIHVVHSEAEALLLEGRLIKEFHPRYNVSFRDDKRFLMIKVNLNDAIPKFTLTRIKQEDGSRYFGPFPDSGAVRNILMLIRREFNLRGCSTLKPSEQDYKHCLYAHLRYCTAPCIGNVTREQYLQQVQAACDFLDGKCEELADEIEEQMQKAAAAQQFEKAALLRDLLFDLKKTLRRTQKFVRLPYSLPPTIDPNKDLAEIAKVLDLPKPPSHIEGFDISNISGTFSVASMVCFRNGRPDRSNYRRYKIKTVTGQDDFACMAETIRRRYSRLLRESRGETAKSNSDDSSKIKLADNAPLPANMPDLILIDGGRGQLNAALFELEKLGLAKIPVIGLAKEFEEIYTKTKPEPIRLSKDSGALKLLQRIRDESHRFANTYNAKLRLKKISESILDEFPGMGEKRKTELLKKFGSVQRIRLATVEQIAELPGIGLKFAEKLKAFLTARSPVQPDENKPQTSTEQPTGN